MLDRWGCGGVGLLLLVGAVVAGLCQGTLLGLMVFHGEPRAFSLVVLSTISAGISAFFWPVALAATVLLAIEPWTIPEASCLRGGGAELDFNGWMLPLAAPSGLHGLAALAALRLTAREARRSAAVLLSGLPAGVAATALLALLERREARLIDLGCFP